MVDITTILVPTDFSAPADAALDFALMLARRLRAAVHVLHVVDDSARARFWSSEVLSPTLADLPAILVSAGHERLAMRLGTIDPAGLAVTSDVQVGPAAATIVDTARAHASSLIVTGTRGQTGLPHVVLGSIAERLARTAPCPVLAVHTTRPTLERIVAATDFSHAGDDAVQYAAGLARAVGASLHLVHALEDPWPMGSETYVRTAAEIRALLAQDAERLLAERLGELGGDPTGVVIGGAPARVIADVAASKDADMIVLGTHGRGAIAHLLLGSVADRVMRIAARPTLVVRRRAVMADTRVAGRAS